MNVCREIEIRVNEGIKYLREKRRRMPIFLYIYQNLVVTTHCNNGI